MSLKIEQLRKYLIQKNAVACIIPSTDSHQSEYIADHWKLLEHLSSFSGSAGTLVVTLKEAFLWTDSRYFTQAENELEGSGIVLKRLGKARKPEHLFWLRDNLDANSGVLFDGRLFSMTQLQGIESMFAGKNLSLIEIGELPSEIWEDQPSLPLSPIFRHELQYCGKSSRDKLQELRTFLKEQKADFQLISSLDDIAWLFNIRGSDVAYNPVVYSFALVSEEKAILFVNPKKIPSAIVKDLQSEGIELQDYTSIYEYLGNLPINSTVVLDPDKTNVYLRQAIAADCPIIKMPNHTTYLKAIKNEVEIEHWRKVMVKDGVALVKFYIWLEAQLEEGNRVTEWTAAERLHEFRAEQAEFIGDSFGAISAYRASGASPHYSPKKGTSRVIQKEGMYLLDSGGQYLGGTTDITRTISLGMPTPQEKRDFTLVLKGFIQLSKVVFPVGTKGYQLEVLAKTALWEYGLNYLHGTGHGVGFCLNVHEGPQNFGSAVTSDPNSAFEVGMVTTIEPAFYRPQHYGIRTENVVITIHSEFQSFLKHEAITLFPIATNLTDKSLLHSDELQWLEDYHQKVWQDLSPHLSEKEQDWLKSAMDF
ncbi:MAG: aminopeptidase P family N-terminal domain-containing protein [Chitinophagales bacterium]